MAELYAHRLEENIEVLSKYFLVFPERIAVILNDKTDSTNGYATPIPYNHIMLYPVLPGPFETISEYGDWARELTLHEYTHILSFQPRRGVVKVLYSLFGSLITPNLFLPRWWLEGIAVEMETRTSHHGRLRSLYQDAIIRSYVLNSELEEVNLAEINEVSIHTWPYGARPYLFGSLMWSEILAKKGKIAIQELHWRYGGRIPFFIEGPAEDILGINYYELFEEMKTTVSTKVEHQFKILKSEAPTSFEDINKQETDSKQDELENLSPVISPDGLMMAYISKDTTSKRSVKILKRPDTKTSFNTSQRIDMLEQKLNEESSSTSPLPKNNDGPPTGTIQRLSWFPDSKKIIYDKIDSFGKFSEPSDLHIYDLVKKKNIQLTFKARAREPSVSPDGKFVVFVSLDAGRTHLSLLHLESQSIRRIYSGEIQSRASYPIFLSEKTILFSERKNNQDIIQTLNIETGTATRAFENFKETRFPFQTTKGLFFTSANNGVNNLYLADKSIDVSEINGIAASKEEARRPTTRRPHKPDDEGNKDPINFGHIYSEYKSARPITHSLTSVFSADYDPFLKDIYFTTLTSQGLKIVRSNENDWFSEEQQLPQVQPLFDDRYPKQNNDNDSKKVDLNLPSPENYSPWSYLIPRYWFPNLIIGNDGVFVSAQTSAFDPLMKHSYSIFGSWDSSIHKGNYNFLYKNNSTEAEISFKSYNINTNLPFLGWEYQDQYHSLEGQWLLIPTLNSLYFGGGWVWRSRKFEDLTTHNQGPTVKIDFIDYSMSGAQISPETGHGVSASYTQYLKNENWQGFDQWDYFFTKYFSKHLPKRHAIMTKVQGRYISGTTTKADLNPTLEYSLFPNSPIPQFVIRGFRAGQFIGLTMNNATFEYRLPLSYTYRGAGTTPLFIRRLHAALVADGIQLDGYALKNDSLFYEKIDRSQTFWGGGLELKADLTLGFHIPLTAFAGLYNSLPNPYSRESRFIIGFQSN